MIHHRRAAALFPILELSDTVTASSSFINYAVVDAFTDTPFKGNPAAVCLLPCWQEVHWMQQVAAEFNLSQTAFVVRRSHGSGSANDNKEAIPPSYAMNDFDIRWFTPLQEVDLCGHATLASSHLLFASGIASGDLIHLHSRKSGVLRARKIEIASKSGDDHTTDERPDLDKFLVELDFPLLSCSDCNDEPVVLSHTLKDLTPLSLCKTSSNDILVELPSGEHVEQLEPCLEEIKKINARGLIVTGRAPDHSGFDFVSRFFAPRVGIDEDPVCGQAHCALAGFWATKLNKTSLTAYQASKRGGILHIKVDFEAARVYLQGEAILVMSGVLINK